jgi:hypothetical protein
VRPEDTPIVIVHGRLLRNPSNDELAAATGLPAPADRPDPLAMLEENNRLRLPDLIPVHYGRMLASPFAFLRGYAVIMANDLGQTPDSRRDRAQSPAISAPS